MKTLAILLAVLIVAAAFILLNLGQPPEPRDLVKNKTMDSFSTMLFEYEIFRYPSNVEIKQMDRPEDNITLGFVTDPWNINFGVIPGNGTVVQRNIVLSNKKDKDSRISLVSYGNVSKMVRFSENDFVLRNGENASIDIFLNSSRAEYGNYTGEIDVIVKKAIYNFLPI
jgi:hypothetical protein